MTNSGVPGSFGITPVAPILVNGSPIEIITAAQRLQDDKKGQKPVPDAGFWSSLPRLSTDTTREVFEVALNSPKRINMVSLALARFPHRAFVQYQDEDGLWQSALHSQHGNPLSFTLTDSIPSNIPSQMATPNKVHPMHYGAGHWVEYRATFRAVTTTRVRIVLVRIPGSPPVDRNNIQIPYPLGVKDFYVGFDSTQREFIPRMPFVSDTEHAPFTTGNDLLGSALSFAVRETPAKRIAEGRPWKCAPQPIPNAVVNMYLDVRDEANLPQIVDRFYVEPIYTGAKVNIYYTNDVVVGTGKDSNDTPLSFEDITANQLVDPYYEGLRFNANGQLSILNTAVHFDALEPFWVGIEIQPQFASDDVVVPFVLFSYGDLVLEWNGTGWDAAYGVEGVTSTFSFSANESIAFVLHYDGVEFGMNANGVETETIAINSPVFESDALIVFGDQSSLSSFMLTNVVIKNSYSTPDDYIDFLLDPTPYVVRDEFPYSDDASTRGAILRFSDSMKRFRNDTLAVWGFVGGPLIDYDSVVWKPINRDFEMRKGYWRFDQVKASLFKFEMTDLNAQPYDVQEPVVRTVNVFPDNPGTPATASIQTATSLTSTKGGAVPMVAVDTAFSTLSFEDISTLPAEREQVPSRIHSPTEALYSEDPVLASNLRKSGSLLNYRRWKESTARFRFVSEQTHQYRRVEVLHDARIAYFTGVKRILPLRASLTTHDDVDQYIEVFHDDTHLFEVTGLWDPLEFVPDVGLTTRESEDTLAMQSTEYLTNLMVRGMHLATQQTDAVQVLTNPDFEPDQMLDHWQPFGDATLLYSEQYVQQIGTTAVIQRGWIPRWWESIEMIYRVVPGEPPTDPPTKGWAGIENDGITWADFDGTGYGDSMGGIESTEFITPAGDGRMYAAARVYTPVELRNPLYVQIITSTGDVLAEEAKMPVPGEVTEWYVGYNIGDGGDTVAQTWDEVEWAYPPPSSPSGRSTYREMGRYYWAEISNRRLPLVADLGVRVIQKRPSADQIYVDNLSLFEDPIVWEFSNDGEHFDKVTDIRNNAEAAFYFPYVDNTSNRLLWRVRASRPHCWITSIAIRPIYAETGLAQPFREGMERGDANVSVADGYVSLKRDPRWQMIWNSPVPQWWWYDHQQWMMRMSA